MVSVIGLGFVGSAVFKSFAINKIEPLFGFDKYKDGGIGDFEECLQAPIIFLCLPTLYDHEEREYDKKAINETLSRLDEAEYRGIIVLKSTVEPGTCDALSSQYPSLSIMHNPEFLSAATAFHDFHYQDHIVIGNGKNCSEEQLQFVASFYQNTYPDAEISLCTSLESESMKSFVNSFYSVKVQFFNELYLLTQSMGADYEKVKELMLKNKWINPMHTTVPGHDGKLSYGGACFPKDTNALLQCMKRNKTCHAVLEGCVRERNVLRGEGSLNKKINGDIIVAKSKEIIKSDFFGGINGLSYDKLRKGLRIEA